MVAIPTPRRPVCLRHGTFISSCEDCHEVRRDAIAAASAQHQAAGR